MVLTISLSSVSNNKNVSENVTTVKNITVSGFSSDITKIVEEIKTSNCVVDSASSIGSGFIYGDTQEKIYVVTAYHVVNDASNVEVILSNNHKHQAEVVGYDPYLDLALLSFDKDVDVVSIKAGDASLLKDGEFVYMIGTSSNIELANSLSLGIVSSNLRTITNSIKLDNKIYDYYLDDIQLSSTVSSGYSGSAVYNAAGEVVGVITMSSKNGEVFATPINEVIRFIENIQRENPSIVLPLNIKGEYISQMEIYNKNTYGLNLEINKGYYVEDLKLNSIFKEIGVKKGDVILSVNDIELNNYSDYLKIKYSDLSQIKVKVIRDNEEIELVGTFNND